MALVNSCRASLGTARSWLCLATPALAPALATKTVGVQTYGEFEPVRSQSTLTSAPPKEAEEQTEDDDEQERKLVFQPIDMATLAPGLAKEELRSLGGRNQKWCELNYETLSIMMNRGNMWLIDVREKNEIQKAGKIPQSMNIPLSTLKEALLQDSDDFFSQYGFPKPQKQDEYMVFYSLNHVKGGTALEIAHRLGYRKARQYAGGYQDWLTRQMEFMPLGNDDAQ